MDAKKNITDDALILVKLRNEFYKKKYYLMIGIYVLSLIVIAFLLSTLLYLLKHSTRPLYFVATPEGRLIQEIPVNVPFPTEQVLAWTGAAVAAANSFDFVNYRIQLQGAQKYFSDPGWLGYMKALSASLNLLSVTERREVWISKISNLKLLGETTTASGYYAWKIEMKMRQTRLKPPLYELTPTSSSSVDYKVTVVVRRQLLLQSYKGLAILTIVLEPIGSSQGKTLIMSSNQRATIY